MTKSESISNTRQPNGSGNFTLLKSGKWNIRKGAVRLHDGKYKVLSATAATKSACNRLIDKKVNEWVYGRSGTEEEMTLSELCQLHLDYDVKKNELANKSRNRRQNTIEEIKKSPIGGLPLFCIKPTDLEPAIINMKSIADPDKILSVSSREKIMNVISAAYEWGILSNYVTSNPMRAIKKPLKRRFQKESKKNSDDVDVIVLSESECERFVKAAREVDSFGEPKYSAGMLALFLLETGLRIGEALALRWSDWNEKHNTLNISKSRSSSRDEKAKAGKRCIMREGDTKNYKARVIELNEKASGYLEEIKASRNKANPSDYIFITNTGKPDTTSNVEHKVERIYKEAKIYDTDGEVMSKLHILRHTFATRLYDNGNVSIEIVAAYIGDTVEVARKYYVANRVKDDNKGVYIPLPKKS